MRGILLAFLFASSFYFPANAQNLILTTENYPPFNFVHPKTGEISGVSTEKVIEIMRRANEKFTLIAYPWSRALQMAHNDDNTCVFSTSRTLERESQFKWIGPLMKINWAIFARADDVRKPNTLSALLPYVMGAYRNDAVGAFLTLQGFKTDIANSDSDNPRKLLYRRFDFWATEELHGIDILKAQGLSEKIVPLFHFHQSEMYLACNARIAQGRINRYNQILKKMVRDGTVTEIEKKYQ